MLTEKLQLWDVCSDQEAVDLVREIHDPGEGAKLLVDHALNRYSTDNLSCMVVRLDKEALAQSQASQDADPEANHGAVSKVSEADKIVMDTKQKIADGQTPAVGVSASNSGRGYDNSSANERDFVPTTLSDALVEEPFAIEDSDGPELIPLDTSVDKPTAAAAQESKDEPKELADA
jgi:protein phosphatase PTC1